MDDGLPQNSIKDITKDKYGFIWLSTDGGIVRYDGNSFLTYNNLKTKTSNFKDFLNLDNGDIVCVNNSPENSVLISKRRVQILCKKLPKTDLVIDNKHCQRFFKCKFTENFYPDIDYYFIQTKSEKYFFSDHHLAYQKEGQVRKTILTDVLLKSLRNAFEEDGTIYIMDPSKRRTIILKNGNISYDNSLSLYNHPKTKIYWHQGNRQVFIINDGNIYLSKKIDGKLHLKFLFRYKNIENEFLNCMYFDEDSQKMYFGDLTKGLNIVNLSNFYTSQKRVPFFGEFVYEALPFTSSSIISKQGFEYSKDRVKKIYSAYFNYDRRFIIYDNSNNLLYIEFHKIQRRYRNSNYQKHDSISFHNKKVEGLFKIRNRFFVIFKDAKFENYSLNIFSDDTFKTTKNAISFKENINSIIEFNDDLLYIGTNNGIYLLSISKNKILKHFAKNLAIKEIQKTSDKNLWLTTYGRGFYALKNNLPVRLLNDKDGYIDNAHHLLEDQQGFFWISSNNGLFKVRKRSLLEYIQNKNTTVNYYRYSKEDGLLNNEFNGSANPSGNILENGDFVFPSMEGFVFFNPKEIPSHYLKKNKLFIERAKIGKQIISFTDTLILKSNYKTAEILLDFPYFHNINNLSVETQLEGDNSSKWEGLKTNRKYLLSNVPPGNYILKIRYLISEDNTYAYKKIFINIKPFFYQTVLFKVFMTILSATVVFLLIYIRTSSLRAVNRRLRIKLNTKDNELELTASKLKNEKEYQQKIIKSITHDITTPVKFIAKLSHEISISGDPEKQKKYFEGIYKTSEELFTFTQNLKEYTKLFQESSIFDEEEYSLYSVVESKKQLFEQIAMSKNTMITNHCNPDLTIQINKNILSTILHNLIDNAVKFTHDGEIHIGHSTKDNEIEIYILDTGVGISKDQIIYYSDIFASEDAESFVFKNYELGLHMVIQLVKKLDLKITFQENNPVGTVVKIILKKESND